jgi:hypothetical protein
VGNRRPPIPSEHARPTGLARARGEIGQGDRVQMLTSLADGKGVVVVPDGRAVVGGPVARVGPARRPVLQQQ